MAAPISDFRFGIYVKICIYGVLLAFCNGRAVTQLSYKVTKLPYKLRNLVTKVTERPSYTYKR